MYFPKNINSWDKLQGLLEHIDSNKLSCSIIFYTPWDNVSHSIRKADFKVNLFEVPEAYPVFNDALYEGVLPPLNYSPTLIQVEYHNEDGLSFNSCRVVDNCAGIQHELVSG